MRLKKPLVTVTLPFADQKRVTIFYQILMNVDKRINRSQPEQKKAKSKQKYEKIGSLKKRACLFVAAVLRSCADFPDCGKNTTDRIVAEYCCGIRPNDRLLNTALIKVASTE